MSTSRKKDKGISKTGWCLHAFLLFDSFLFLTSVGAHAQQPVHWAIGAHTAKSVAPGQAFEVTLTAEIDPGWKLYATTQPAGGPVPTTFAIPEASPFELASSVAGQLPERAHDPNFDIETEFHEIEAVFQAHVRAKPGTAGRRTLTIEVGFQTCNDQFCLPPTVVPLAVDVTVTSGSPPARMTAGAARMRPAEVSGPAVAAPVLPAIPSAEAITAQSGVPARVQDLAAGRGARTLSAYLWLAAAMGALSLLTPCVFPMVPITVSYFTNRGERIRPERRRQEAAMQAVAYGLGIILTFTAIGFAVAFAFGASGLNRFAANPWLNLAVTALFIAFALDLFGVFALALPSWLLTRLANASSRVTGRYGGTLLMGLAFTLTSFTCTAPFLGTLLVVAAQGDWQWPLAGMLVFSTVFALPFFVLALAPQLVASLPRSGAWLLSVKITMGLLELAAAMKFLSNVDLVWHWGVFTREIVIVAWIAIAALMALYLTGMIGLGHVPRLGRLAPFRSTAALASLAIAVWLATGLTGRRLGEIEAFLPPMNLADPINGELGWIVNDYDGALNHAAGEHRPVFVDFTGYTCTNCRWMEANMFPRPEVARELGRYVRVRLYTDGRGEVYQHYQQMQQRLFGTVALPYYAVMTSSGEPIVAFGGLTRDAGRFVSFLQRGLN